MKPEMKSELEQVIAQNIVVNRRAVANYDRVRTASLKPQPVVDGVIRIKRNAA